MSPPESYLYWFRNAARRRYLLAMDLASTASRQETSRDSSRTHLAYSWRKACRPYRNASAEGIHIFGANCPRSEEHTSELQSRRDLVCRLLLEKKKNHLGFSW